MNWKEILANCRTALTGELFVIAGTAITGATLLTFLTIIGVTFWLAGLVQNMVERLLSRHSNQDEGNVGAISRLMRYVTLVLGLGVAFHTVGINLSALFAAGALFAVAIGFAMQNIVANFVSGIILLGERTIKPGDILEVEGSMVRVTDIGIRATKVRTLDHEDMLIPNSILVQAPVKNLTLNDRLCRLRVAVGVAYDSDLRLVRQVLTDTCLGLSWRSQLRDPVVLLDNFGNSSVDYEVSVWIEEPWNSRRARSEIREAIWWAFKDASIVIAFPQMDVHFDEPVMRSLQQDRRRRLPEAAISDAAVSDAAVSDAVADAFDDDAERDGTPRDGKPPAV